MSPLKNPARLLTCAALPLILFAPGCGGGDEPAAGTPGGGAPATVIVDGSSTVFRISKAVQEAYGDVKPEVTVVVDNHGTGGGFSRYLQGEVDVVDASRDAKPDETAKAKAQGIEWTRFLVGYDGITLVVHPKNDFVKSFSVAQLKAIWEPNSKVKTWKDVDPSWPDRKIALYSPDSDSGTFEFFTEQITGKAKSQRDDVQPSSDDNILVSGVAGDPDALGYFGYAYFAANSQKLRAVPVQVGDDAKPVAPSHQTVLDGSYKPLSRPLYIFVKNSALRRPEVADFVKYYLANVARFAEKGGYVAPRPEDLSANEQSLAASTGGAGAKAAAPAAQ
jgi:phosphate transport system substrate-binding protein